MADAAYLSPAEVAAVLRCSTRTIQRVIKAGGLDAVRVSERVVRVPADSYAAFIGKSDDKGAKRARPAGEANRSDARKGAAA